jgi:outer membrane lipoprotein-sorting protein
MLVFSSARLAFLLAGFMATIPLFSWGQAQTLRLDQILTRMAQTRAAEHDHSVAYTVTREYQLTAQGAAQADSQVVAQVNFTPPAAKDYTIVKSQGGDRGTGIVRKVLDHESSMAGQAQAHEVSAQNYNIALVGRETIDGHDCYVLQLSPKREAVELVRGTAWVDASNFELRRIAGKTAKSPSFWIKNLNVTINYGEVKGVWLQTSTQATADVRIAGPHVLTSRELDVRTATFDARAQAPAKVFTRRSNAHHAVADAATWVPR